MFTNEFIYEETKEETNALRLLQESIEVSLREGKTVSEYDIACIASFRALHLFEWVEDIKFYPKLDFIVKKAGDRGAKGIGTKETYPKLEANHLRDLIESSRSI